MSEILLRTSLPDSARKMDFPGLNRGGARLTRVARGQARKRPTSAYIRQSQPDSGRALQIDR